MKNTVLAFILVLFYVALSAQDADKDVAKKEPKEVSKEAPKEPVKKEWSHSTGAGLTITSGNSETTTASLSHNSTWERGKNKLTFSLNGNYGVKEKVDSSGNKRNEEFVNNISEKAQFNRNFSDNFYWYVAQSAEEDKIINLEYRLTLGPGLGLNVIKKDPLKLDFELGVVYINQKYEDISSEDNMSGRIAEKFNWKISSTSNLWLNIEGLVNLEDSDDYRINAELGIDVKINQNWLIRATIQDKFYNNAPDLTEKNDIIFMTSIVFKY